jgi:UDP-GlcNAc:undecaprenyl-phosphate GlcNAc-1-phosphate transferase
MTISALWMSLTSLVVAACCMPLLVRALTRAGAVDRPNARSSHQNAVPRGAGLGIALGVASGTVMGAAAGYDIPLALLLYVGVQLILGAGEDLLGIAVWLRLSVQIASAALVVVHYWFGSNGPGHGWVLGPFVVIALVGCVNAFNFMDGINGISAFTAIAASVWYLHLGIALDVDWIIVLAATLLGASAGFLPWNVPTARIFLGDSGSYAMGAMLGVLAVISRSSGATVLEAVVPLSIYLLDTGWTLFRRLARGESAATPHREHAYQRIVDQVGSHALASALVVVYVCAGLLIVLLTPHAFLSWVLVLGVGCLYLATPSTRWLVK